MDKTILKYILVAFICFGTAFFYFKFISRPLYTSTVVVYPSSTLNPQYLLEGGLRFGDEKELNELIEILNSNQVLLAVANQEGKALAFVDPVKRLKKNTRIERGVNRSVSISVDHENPQMAANLANAYAKAAYDRLAGMITPNIVAQLNVVIEQYESKVKEVSALQDTLKKLEALGDVKVSGFLLVKSPRYRFFDSRFEAELKKQNDLKAQKEHIEGILKKKTPSLNVVSSAVPAKEPSKPNAPLYSLLFTLFGMLSFAAALNYKIFFTSLHGK